MSLTNFGNPKDVSSKARVFAQKAIRSIIEVQPKLNNISDLLMLLEVLGFTNSLARKNGFESLLDLATYIYKIIDVYDFTDYSEDDFIKDSLIPVPSTIRRVSEGLSLMFPWLGSLVVLMLTGVSLWMIYVLPIEYTTALIIGVFVGLVITEGPLQSFGRLIGFYYGQTNLDEVKRLIKRNYALTFGIMSGAIGIIFGIGIYTNMPIELITITSISLATVSLHRASYVIVYALRRVRDLLASYSGALAALLLVYFYSTDILPDAITRYIVALSTAFGILTAVAIYNHFKMLSNTTISPVAKDTPHFYNPVSIRKNTIKSRFHVQLWETMPYFLSGTFFFLMLFLDRIISWIFNPVITAIPGATVLMEFNTVYHTGADPALFVLLPATLLQYVIMGPIYAHVINFNLKHSLDELDKLKQLLSKFYQKTLAATLISSLGMLLLFNLFETEILSLVAASEVSTQIFKTASIANVFASLLSVNFMFMVFLNKIKIGLIIIMISAAILGVTGFILGQTGFENIVYAYLAATIFGAAVSSIYVKTMFKNSVSVLFSKFI